MRRALTAITWATIAIGVLVPVLYAADITQALFSIDFRLRNNSATSSNDQYPMPFATSPMIDAGILEADALNSAMRYGSVDVASMPGTNRMSMLGAVHSSTVLVTQTPGSNNQTPNDLTFLTSSPAVGQAYNFGFDTRGRYMTINVGTAGAGTYTITWEYYSSTSSSYIAVEGLSDGTNGFQTAGTSTVSFSMPGNDWIRSDVNGITAYWIRARLSTFTSLTTQPLGTRTYWETGQWWTFVDTLLKGQDRIYTLHLGGPIDMQTRHAIFVEPSGGITTTDSADLELRNVDNYILTIDGYLDTTATGTTRSIARKGSNNLNIYASDVHEVTARLEGPSVTRSLTLTGITPGEYVTTFSLNNTTSVLTFRIGDHVATTSGGLVNPNNNPDPWQFGIGGMMPYVNEIRLAAQSFASGVLAVFGDDAVALWVMEATGATLEDLTGNGHTLTWSEPVENFNAAPAALGSGHLVTFNGSDESGIVADAAGLSFGNGSTDEPFSVVALIKTPGSFGQNYFLSKRADGLSTQEWAVRISDDLRFTVWDHSTGFFHQRRRENYLSTNTEYLITMTYGGDESDPPADMNIYDGDIAVDNARTSAGPGGSSYTAMEDTSADLSIANRDPASPAFFPGSVAWMGIVGKELTVDEIDSLISLTNGFSDLSLGDGSAKLLSNETILWYQLTSTPTTTIFDLSGNGHNAQMNWPDTPASVGNPNTAATVGITPGILISTNQPEAVSLGVQVAAMVAPVAEVKLFLTSTTSTGSGLPGIALINDLLVSGGVQTLPIEVFWVGLALMGVVGTMLGVWARTRHVWFSLLAGLAVLIALTRLGNGILPAVVLFIYIPVMLLAGSLQGRLR